MDEIVAGKIIAELRKKKGLTQKQLAAVLGVTEKAVSRWENEYGLPDVSLLPKIAAAFDVTVDELLTGRRPHSSVSETPSSAPPARQTSSEGEIGKICEENRRGLFRLRLRQVTQNEFTFPALFVYLALFCLCLFYSPVQATLSRGAYSLSPCEWLRCIFDKPYLHGYFSVDTKNRLETFLTLLPFLSFVQLVLSLALLVKTVKGNPGGGMKPEWCLAFVTALGILLAGSCIPFVNKIYGTEKYKIPAGYYPIAALGVLQLVGGYAVSCHRKPKRKIKLFSAAAVLSALPFFAAIAVSGRTLPKQLSFSESPQSGTVGIQYYGTGAGGYGFSVGYVTLKTNRTIGRVSVKSCLYIYDSGLRTDSRPADIFIVRYRLQEGYAAILSFHAFPHYPPGNRESGEVVSLSLLVDIDGTETAFAFNAFTLIESWTDELEKAETALHYERKFSPSDF